MNKTQFNKISRYNLSVVMQETDLKADVIRIWEKRYGIPAPNRSKGGHRLYSEFDIATIKWLQNRQKEGMTIGRAIKLYRDIENEGKDPFEIYPLFVFLDSDKDNSQSKQSLDSLRNLWLEACYKFDEKKADEILNLAFSQFSLEETVTQILQKGLSEIGQAWYEGKASVQQEHFASELAMRKVHTLITDSPKKHKDKTVLIGSPENELHSFHPLLMNLLLRYRGWQVVNLGSNVPFNDFKKTIEIVKPDLVFYSAMRLNTASKLIKIGNYLIDEKIIFTYSGWIFSQLSDLTKYVPGNYVGDDLLEAVAMIERLLSVSQNEIINKNLLSETSLQELFEMNQIKIESNVEKLLTQNNSMENYPIKDLRIIHSFFAEGIIAGLEFGDLNLLQLDVNWIAGYMNNLNISTNFLHQYFEAYAQAIEEIIGDKGRRITAWLKTL